MFHRRRAWSVSMVPTAETLATMLTEHVWCCCNGFRVHGTRYLFLNDATCADGAQEYAVVKQLAGGHLCQVDSLTLGSWVTTERARALIEETLDGQFDDSEFAHAVEAVVHTPEQHGRCPHCA